MGTRILVTGGTGYIGSHTVVELENAGFEVVIIDNLSNSNKDVLDGIERITGIRPNFVEADCTDIVALRKLFQDYPGINHQLCGKQGRRRIRTKAVALLPQQSQYAD